MHLQPIPHLTMSSREIAELTGSSHDNVMKTVRRLVEEGVVSGNETPYTHTQNGQTYPEFLLSFRDTMVVVSGYSAELRARIIDRWQELESNQGPSVPKTLAQALRLAADQAEELDQQRAALALAAPKVEYVDRYVAANGALGFRQVAKLLKANEHEFRAWLQDQKIMYRLGGEWAAYQNHIEAGRFVVKAGVATRNEHAFNTTKFTPKGVLWITGEWAKHKVAEQVAA